MPLSWNEIKDRALRFSKEWEGERRERAEKDTFWNQFFHVFGISRRRVATFEAPVKKLNDQYGFIDLFWKGKLLLEHKSGGEDLGKAYTQAVLDTRANYPDSSLADLYDPLTMPPDLVKAHQALDKAVDQCYRKKAFANERERIEFLFELYEEYTAPLFEKK